MILFGVMLLLFFLGFPIGSSLLLSSLIFFLISGQIDSMLMMPTKMVSTLNSFPLLAVPFFMLAGELMNTAKITDWVFDFAKGLVGHIRGGLGHVNVLSSMLFAGMSGSALADASGLGQVEIKAMKDAGYPSGFSAAITAASACIGPIIPPSVGMVICGLVTGQSIGKLLLGGAIPGALMGLGLMLVVYIIAKKNHYPKDPFPGILTILKSFKQAFFPLMTPFILIGGILSGIFTPTEAAVVTCIYAIILGLAYRQLSLKQIYDAFITVGIRTGALAFIVVAAQVFGTITVQELIPQRLTTALISVTTDSTLMMFIILGIFLILGCVLSDIAVLMIMGPMLMPVVIKVGVDPIVFGVWMVIVLGLGMITPPYGMVMFMANIWAGTSVLQFTRAIVPFLLVLLAVTVLIIFFPKIVLFIPDLVMPAH